MISRRLFALFVTLLLAATAHADTLRATVASSPMPADTNLLACNATLVGLTALGLVLGMRRRPASRVQRVAAR